MVFSTSLSQYRATSSIFPAKHHALDLASIDAVRLAGEPEYLADLVQLHSRARNVGPQHAAEVEFFGVAVKVGTHVEAAGHVTIGGDTYFLSAEGLLMPTRKDQPPPRLDLKYFRSR
jgi:hypothetical protein